MPANERRERVVRTFRVIPRDKATLQWLGGDEDPALDRHHALMAMTEIVQTLNIEDIREQDRVPIQMGIPIELDQALEAKKATTGQPYLTILLEAARAYVAMRREVINHEPRTV